MCLIMMIQVSGNILYLHFSMAHSGSFFCNAAIASSLCFIPGVLTRLSFINFLKTEDEKHKENNNSSNLRVWKRQRIISIIITLTYRKIPMISPGFIFVQKAFLLGLFSGEAIFRGACYQKEFCVSAQNRNSPWAYIRLGGLIIGRIFASVIWGAYFREGLVLGGLIIGILWSSQSPQG